MPGEEELQDYFEEISQKIEYREWFFGHWHVDWKEGKFRALWNEIAELKNYTKRLITYCRKMKIRVLYFY
jgi:hypothetical protein